MYDCTNTVIQGLLVYVCCTNTLIQDYIKIFAFSNTKSS